MKIKSVVIASVSAVFLATGVAATGASAAESQKPEALMHQAYTHLVSGKAEEAVAGYTSAINHDGIDLQEKARALLNRALAHQNLGAQEKAVEDYTQAINLDALNAKTRAAALYNRGLAHARMKQHFAAVDDFTNALYLDPHLAEAFYSRANVLRESGQHDYALLDYARATSNGYRHKHLAWYGKALTLAELGHRDEATAAFLKAYGLKPGFKEARERLAELGVDVPAEPSKEQIKLAVLPAQNLMSDNLVTGSTSTPVVTMAKAGQKEPVAPPPAMLNGLKPVAPSLTVAAAENATPVKPLPVKPEAISVKDVGPVPAASKPVAASVQAAQAEAASKPEVKIEPVSASSPSSSNLSQPVAEKGVSERFEGWTVQLVSQRDADSAWSNWEKIQSRHGKLLSDAEVAVIRADLGDQGIYYRLRVHKLGSKDEASRLCRTLKRKGTSCFVAQAI